jgi:very-short-patch-repair endonuclease
VWYNTEKAEFLNPSVLYNYKIERNKLHYTNIEEKVRDYLEKENKEYVFQLPTRTGFVIDFALLKQRIAIEVDGTNWHSSKEAKKRDRFKDYQLKREGWKVIRVKEEEIDNLDSLLSSI